MTILTAEAHQQIRVLIVHGTPLFSLGLCSTLEQHGVQIVGEATKLEEIPEVIRSRRPDVVVFDGTLTFGDAYRRYSAVEMVAQVRQAGGRGIIVLVPAAHEEHLFAFMRAGAAAYELDRLSGDSLVEKVQLVACGSYLISGEVLPQLSECHDTQPSEVQPEREALPQDPSGVTAREQEVLRAVAAGLSNKEIARELGISDQTAKNHITNILRKLRATDRTAAVVVALRCGLITLPAQEGITVLSQEQQRGVRDLRAALATIRAEGHREEVAV